MMRRIVYYDPEVTRWVNGDKMIYGESGETIYNIYVYCFNNPVNYDDGYGELPNFLQNILKTVAQTIVKPVVENIKKMIGISVNTYSEGICLSASLDYISGGAQLGYSYDINGGFAIQATGAINVSTGSPGVSITKYKTETNAPSVLEFEEDSYQYGGSAGIPLYGIPFYIGEDINYIKNSHTNKEWYGHTDYFGVGTPGGEIHMGTGWTTTIIYINFYELYKEILGGKDEG